MIPKSLLYLFYNREKKMSTKISQKAKNNFFPQNYCKIYKKMVK
jgi:hypothetical protein